MKQQPINKIPAMNIPQGYNPEIYYNNGGFNVPGLMFMPAVPDKWGPRFEPTEVFRNVYFIGDYSICCLLYKTSQGIIMWDSLECAADMTDILETDMKKLGLDIADIKICLVSHGHYDHFGGARYLQKTYGTKVYLAEKDVETIKTHITHLEPGLFDEEPPVIDADKYLVDGQSITLGEVTFTLMWTPGHSPGSMSFFVPVTAFDGTKHTLCCWGGTSAPRDLAGMKTYLASVQEFHKYIKDNHVDAFLSMHPFVDYSTDKVAVIRSTHNSDALIQTPEEMDLFMRALEVVTQARPRLTNSGTAVFKMVSFPGEFDNKYGAYAFGFGSAVLSWPYTVYIPEEKTGNGSIYLNQIIRVKIFDNVYFVGTGKDTCLIYDTKDGIVITDAMTDESDFTKIVKPAMMSFGLDPRRIKAVMITHGHADKTGFASYLQRIYGARIYLNKLDSNISPDLKIDVDLVEDSYKFGEFIFDWVFTPGHTLGCMSYLVNVSIDGKAHVAACWGGTTFVYEKKMLEDYSSSIDRFKELCARKGADAIVSTHPYVDYSVEKVFDIIAGHKDAFILKGENSVDFALTCISVTAHYKLKYLEQ